MTQQREDGRWKVKSTSTRFLATAVLLAISATLLESGAALLHRLVIVGLATVLYLMAVSK